MMMDNTQSMIAQQNKNISIHVDNVNNPKSIEPYEEQKSIMPAGLSQMSQHHQLIVPNENERGREMIKKNFSMQLKDPIIHTPQDLIKIELMAKDQASTQAAL